MKPGRPIAGLLYMSVAAFSLAVLPPSAMAKPKHVTPGPKIVTPGPKIVTPGPKHVTPGPKYATPGPKYAKPCPPGLAKKGSCIPPGLRKRWGVGDYIPRDVAYRRVYYQEYDLPRPERGYFYANIGGDVYLLAEATRRVIEAINLVDLASQ